jgi:hypothetical protein
MNENDPSSEPVLCPVYININNLPVAMSTPESYNSINICVVEPHPKGFLRLFS